MNDAASAQPANLSSRLQARSAPRDLTHTELEVLRRVANALIPPERGYPGGAQVAAFPALVAEALAILDRQFDIIAGELARLSDTADSDMLDTLRVRCTADPDAFYWLSALVTAVYVYSDEITAELAYPHPHRNPAGLTDAADELDSGILEPVVARGPIYTPAD